MTRLFSSAYLTNSVLLEVHVFINNLLTYFSTFLIDVSSFLAISLFIRPSATSCKTLASLGVKLGIVISLSWLFELLLVSIDFISVICLAILLTSVSANLAAAFNDVDDENYGQVYNVGSGKNYSVNEIASWISDKQVHLPERVGEVRVSLANIDKIKNVFGWEPKVDLEEWVRSR